MRLSAQSSTIRSVAAMFGSSFAAAGLGAAGGVIVAYFLAPEELGRFRVYTLPLMYLTILQFGTPDGLLRLLPLYQGTGQEGRQLSVAAAAGAWNLIISVLVSACLVGLALHSAFVGHYEGFFAWLSQALLAWPLFYGGYLASTYRTLNNFVALAKIELIQSIVQFILVSTVPSLRFYGLCVRASLPNVLGLLLLHKTKPLNVQLKIRKNELKEVFKTGMPFFAWNYISAPLWLATEASLILHFGDHQELGYFAVAAVFRDAICILPRSIHQVLTPKTVQAYAQGTDLGTLNRSLAKIAAVNASAMAAISLLSVAALYYLVPLVLPKYSAALPVFAVCSVFSVAQALTLPVNSLFAAGHSWTFGRGIVLGFAAFLATASPLAHLYGAAVGVVCASLAGRLIRTLIALADAHACGAGSTRAA